MKRDNGTETIEVPTKAFVSIEDSIIEIEFDDAKVHDKTIRIYQPEGYKTVVLTGDADGNLPLEVTVSNREDDD